MVVTDPEFRAILEKRLVEAENALHMLNTGQSARVLVDQNGERVEFNPTTVTRLTAYIASIKQQLGVEGPILGPMRFIW